MKTITLSDKTRPLKEHDIQNAIIRRLQADEWLVVRINSGSFKGQAGNYFRGYTIAGLGTSSGFPDVLALKPDRFLLIEVKTEKGKLSQTQRQFHEWAKVRGIEVHVLRHPDELDAILAPIVQRDGA